MGKEKREQIKIKDTVQTARITIGEWEQHFKEMYKNNTNEKDFIMQTGQEDQETTEGLKEI